MLMVDTDAVVVEARLLTGELACPSCGGVLRPWGHRKQDVVRRMLAHAEARRRATERVRPAPAAGYRPDTLQVLFGTEAIW